ncbi:MAG: DEAD/DEAH box helicase family protein [bacterium]|nr:DEAD/DEAH box helicase family protein [bacterium]
MRNERLTCKEVIEPDLRQSDWQWDSQVTIGPGRVNLAGESMYDETQHIIADYILRYGHIPLAVLEAKAESKDAITGLQQAERYAHRLGLRFAISGNGHRYYLVDCITQEREEFTSVPTPRYILQKIGRNIDWDTWRPAFKANYYEDQVTRKKVRPYQDMAIFETLRRFSTGTKRVLLLMATGTGKTFTVFQLAWKLFQSGVLKKNRMLFLTDRNSLKDQAYRAFAAFPAAERVVIDKKTVSQQTHQVGKIFFANYQNLDEELDGKKIYRHFDPDFFDLVVIDECHRSAFGDWFGVLEHFSQAFQLGLTATPRELDKSGRVLTPEEIRRDTYEYFGEPAYVYSLKQAIEDGYLVPYLLEERVSNVDENGYTGPDGRHYTTDNFEREIRLPDRTRMIAEDLWDIMGKYDLREDKTIIFCVDDTHAAFMAQELRRLSGDSDYAARITRSERNSRQLENNFAEVGRSKPRIAVSVDLLSTGYDALDVKNIVFARPVKSSILYKQMKGRGTRLCEDIDKRYFTIFDYAGASILEDAEFDGHPANLHKPGKKSKTKKPGGPPREKPVAQDVHVFMSTSERFVCFADGRKIPFDEYRRQSGEIIRGMASATIDELLKIWIDKKTREDLRNELMDQDIYIAAFRHYFQLETADDVDILSKVGFDLPRIPSRYDRVIRFWDHEENWLKDLMLNQHTGTRNGYLLAAQEKGGYANIQDKPVKVRFWETCLDHYSLFGIDDLEKGGTYSAPQFVDQFGSFSTLLKKYGSADMLRSDLESVKQQLYVPMVL